jgi:hypothetical protein
MFPPPVYGLHPDLLCSASSGPIDQLTAEVATRRDGFNPQERTLLISEQRLAGFARDCKRNRDLRVLEAMVDSSPVEETF